MEAALFCLVGGLDASFFGWAVIELAGVVDGLAVGAGDGDGAVVGFLGAVVGLFAVEGTLVFLFFLGGSFGIFFFCSGIVQCITLSITTSRSFGDKKCLWLVKAQEREQHQIENKSSTCFPRKWQCGVYLV